MAFWGRGDRHLEADRRSTAGDLWPQPPTTAEGAHPVYKPRDWSGSEKNESAMFHALRSYRMVGYWIGLLPVQGILGRDPQKVSFRWTSKETFLTIMIVVVFTSFIVYRTYTGILASKFGTIDHSAFLVGPMFWGIFNLRQAKLFPVLMKKWVSVEKEMQPIGNIPKLKRHLDIIVALNITAALGAISCVQMIWYERVATCSDDLIVQIQLFMVSSFNSLSIVPVHSMNWGVVIVFFIHIYYRLIWMFNELTFMVFSFSLYRLFKLYCDHLDTFRGKEMSEQFWYEMRVRYSSLSRLTKALDGFLSPNTCITFAIDVFFVCLSLFHVFKRNPLTHKIMVYFLFYAISRTLSIALLGSYINDLSKKPLLVLYSVPSPSFCSEVLRFQMEILADDICLTGCRFFSFTRSFIIAIVGSIATYEVVLLQFNTLTIEEFNTTSYCSVFSPKYTVSFNDSLH